MGAACAVDNTLLAWLAPSEASMTVMMWEGHLQDKVQQDCQCSANGEVAHGRHCREGSQTKSYHLCNKNTEGGSLEHVGLWNSTRNLFPT